MFTLAAPACQSAARVNDAPREHNTRNQVAAQRSTALRDTLLEKTSRAVLHKGNGMS
jgi:hypothetical protein